MPVNRSFILVLPPPLERQGTAGERRSPARDLAAAASGRLAAGVDSAKVSMYPSIRMDGRSNSRRPLFDYLAELNDAIRCRLLLALEGEELTVSELCQVLQLPQSTASRHLATLAAGGWITYRKEGTARRYRALIDELPAAARELWLVLRQEVSAGRAAAHDRRRLRDVVARRRSRSQEFFSTAAERWSELRRELFGQRFEAAALTGLLNPDWTVADLGCGSGELSLLLAGGAGRVIAVDDSEAMLQAARGRINGQRNIELRHGRLEALPIADGELDAATLVLVLHHLPEPGAAIVEAARTLKPGGRLLIVDMLPHERDEYQDDMGHVWLGFEPDQINAWLRDAGLRRPRLRSLPTDPAAKGPALFAAVGDRAAGRGGRAPKARSKKR